MKAKSYFICTTPRTGSTFLCSLLKSTEIAGNPESFFRSQDRNKWASQWGIFNSVDNSYDFEEYLEGCFVAGRSKNGLFGCRIMWGTMDELISDIHSLPQNFQGTSKEILDQVFGNSKFVYLKREDYVAQAVSRLRAEQTGVWHVTNKDEKLNYPQVLEYDASKIRDYVREAESHNKAWDAWFEKNGITPYHIIYEDLIKSPETKVSDILSFLGLKVTQDFLIESENRKMSDSLSLEWIEKFKNEEL